LEGLKGSGEDQIQVEFLDNHDNGVKGSKVTTDRFEETIATDDDVIETSADVMLSSLGFDDDDEYHHHTETRESLSAFEINLEHAGIARHQKTFQADTTSTSTNTPCLSVPPLQMPPLGTGAYPIVSTAELMLSNAMSSATSFLGPLGIQQPSVQFWAG
jgi:hypothetical protein